MKCLLSFRRCIRRSTAFQSPLRRSKLKSNHERKLGLKDGQTVTCSGTGQKWTRAVRAGQKSPVCGYAYQRPSLPKGDYTIEATTTWEVTWNVNNESGVITVPRSSTTQLPVGELQALVR